MGYIITLMGDRFSALLVSLMALRLTIFKWSFTSSLARVRVDLLQVFVFLIPPNLTFMKSLRTHHEGWGNYWGMKYFCQPQILAKKSFSPHIIPKTKGLEESLGSGHKDSNPNQDIFKSVNRAYQYIAPVWYCYSFWVIYFFSLN